MKKKLFVIIPVFIAIVVFLIVYSYYNTSDEETSLSVSDKRWIEENALNVIDFEIVNDYPLYGIGGNGVLFSMLSDFSTDTLIEINKVPYSKEETTSSTSYRFRILNNNENLTEKDLVVFEDSYVLISKEDYKITSLEDIESQNVGVFSEEVAELTYYFKSAKNTTLTGYDTIDELYTALDNNEISFIAVPNIMYMDKIMTSDVYKINYYISEVSKKLVLTLSDSDERLNEIVTKYFNNWMNNYYTEEYNNTFFDYYLEKNSIASKDEADLVSKNYIYGYVENAPYEVTIDGQAEGIASEYINRIARLTGIEFEYRKYSSYEQLQQAINDNEIDIAFSNNQHNTSDYLTTTSPFIEKYVVIGKASDQYIINSFEALKNHDVAMLEKDYLYDYVTANNDVNITNYSSVNSIASDSNGRLIVIDKEIYDYYHNTLFIDYDLLYTNSMTNDYRFLISNDDQVFYDMFNYIINTNSYYKYRQNGLNTLQLSLFERSTFETVYFIILGAVLLPIIIAVVTYIIVKKRNQIKVVRKDERRKYTDLLTSLKNRNYLNLKTEEWEASDVYPQAIVVIDLNNVKYVNDNYGHEAGDNLIVKAAAILVNTQLENSEIIRTDGNEFLIYLVGYSEQQMSTYTKKLNKEMKNLPHEFGASIGFSMILDDIKLIGDAINEATIDMRKNKEMDK